MTKLAGLAPPSVTLLTVIDPMPVFVYVKVWAAVCVPTVALPNAVVPVSVAAAATPVPVRAMLCAVAPGTLSVTVRVPARAPVVFGLKATSMRQVALGARVAATQPLLVMRKFDGFTPPIVTVLTVIGTLPVFVYVNVWAAVVAATWPLPNPPVPVSDAVRISTVSTSVAELLARFGSGVVSDGVTRAVLVKVAPDAGNPAVVGLTVPLTVKVTESPGAMAERIFKPVPVRIVPQPVPTVLAQVQLQVPAVIPSAFPAALVTGLRSRKTAPVTVSGPAFATTTV